jgi:protein gp37
MAYRLMHIPGQKETYAGVAKRLPNGRRIFTGFVKELPERLKEPLAKKKPTVYFVDSMSDLFHKDVSFNFQYKVFEVMLLTPQHTYQVLTKRPEIARKRIQDIWFHLKRNYPNIEFPLKNVWGGTSCEDQKTLNSRMPHHLETPWHLHFLSYEPAIGPIDLLKIDSQGLGYMDIFAEKEFAYLSSLFLPGNPNFKYQLSWVICGGESGTGKLIQPMKPAWARKVRDDCKKTGTAFFFKQWGNWSPTEDHKGNRIIGTRYGRFDGDTFLPGNWVVTAFPADTVYMTHVGKHRSGSLLDGVEHKEMPI